MKNLNKKMIIASMVCISTISFADQSFKANVKARFFPVSWVSLNTKDVISITTPTNGGSSYYNVQIHVNQKVSEFEPDYAGIVVKNCNGVGSVDTVAPGSTIVCGLDKENPILSFTSDSDKLVAHGESQVE